MSKIHIKKENRGKFTEYCGGTVTNECIQRGKRSSDPAVRKRATFAANARKWKHSKGGTINKYREGGATRQSVSPFANIEQTKQLLKQLVDAHNNNWIMDPILIRQAQQLLSDVGYDLSYPNTDGSMNSGIDGRLGYTTINAANELYSILNNIEDNAYASDYRSMFGTDPVYNNVAGRDRNTIEKMTNMYYNFYKNNRDLYGKIPYTMAYMNPQIEQMLNVGQYAKDQYDLTRQNAEMNRGKENVIVAASTPAYMVLSALGAAASQAGRIPGYNTIAGGLLGYNLNPDEANGFMGNLTPALNFGVGQVEVNPLTGEPKQNITVGNVIKDSENPTWARQAYNAMTGDEGSADIWSNPVLSELINAGILTGMGELYGTHQMWPEKGLSHTYGYNKPIGLRISMQRTTQVLNTLRMNLRRYLAARYQQGNLSRVQSIELANGYRELSALQAQLQRLQVESRFSVDIEATQRTMTQIHLRMEEILQRMNHTLSTDKGQRFAVKPFTPLHQGPAQQEASSEYIPPQLQWSYYDMPYGRGMAVNNDAGENLYLGPISNTHIPWGEQPQSGQFPTYNNDLLNE